MASVLVTGAASGLGWALAQRLAQRGDRLLLVDRERALLGERVAALAAGVRVLAHVADLADPAERQELLAWARAQGPLDVLINNAGITHRSPARITTLEVYRRVMAVDWEAPVALALGLLPALLESRGMIVNIGSMAGWMPVPGRAGYCSAKAALSQFFEVLRTELADSGVGMLMVYPSFLATSIEANALGATGGPADHRRSTVGRIRSADWMAARILDALATRRERLFPDRFTALASLLYRIAPRRYERMVRRRFRTELDPATGERTRP